MCKRGLSCPSSQLSYRPIRFLTRSLQPFNWQMYRTIINTLISSLPWYKLVTHLGSVLRFLHHVVPAALGGVNRIETYTSVCNLLGRAEASPTLVRSIEIFSIYIYLCMSRTSRLNICISKLFNIRRMR